MNWEIVTYGGAEYFQLIFNAIAMVTKSDGFVGALKTSALMGLISVSIQGIFTRQISLRWFFVMIAIYMVLISNKTNILIRDKITREHYAVGNVPLGLALPASAFSHFGEWITDSFETNFSLPDAAKYSKNGLMFAGHLVEESTRFEITTPRVAANFSDFWKNCVFYDLFFNFYRMEDLIKSDNMMKLFQTKTSLARMFTYEDNSAIRKMVSCREGIGGEKKGTYLAADLATETLNATNIYGVKLYPNEKDKAIAIAKFAAALPNAYKHLTDITLSNQRILEQNILANSFRQGIINFAGSVDASAAAQDYALTKAQMSRNIMFNSMGKLSKKMLPILKNIFEALIYSAFPLLAIMCMLPIAAKVILGYTKILFWIHLWGPLYCILNLTVMYYTKKEAMAAIYQGSNSALSIMTQTNLGNSIDNYVAIAGYLTMSIPLFAWLLINLSGHMVAGLAGGLLGAYGQSISSTAENVSSGNLSMGNISYDNQTAFQHNSAPKESHGYITNQTANGVTQTTTTQGTYLSTARSNLPFQVNWSDSFSQGLKENKDQAISREETTGYEKIRANNDIRTLSGSIGKNLTNSKTDGHSFSSEEAKSYISAKNETEKVVDDWAKKNNYSKDFVRNAMLKLGISGNIGLAKNLFGGKDSASTKDENEIKGSASVKIEGGIGGEGRLSWINRDDFAKISKFAKSEEYTNAVRNEGKAALRFSQNSNSGISASKVTTLGQALQDQTLRSQKHSEAIREVKSASLQEQNAEQITSNLSASGTDGFKNWLQNKTRMSNNEQGELFIKYNNGDKSTRDYLNSELKNYIKEYSSNWSLDEKQFNSEAFKISSDVQKMDFLKEAKYLEETYDSLKPVVFKDNSFFASKNIGGPEGSSFSFPAIPNTPHDNGVMIPGLKPPKVPEIPQSEKFKNQKEEIKNEVNYQVS